jgi:phosphatidate cytidylyltransferase
MTTEVRAVFAALFAVLAVASAAGWCLALARPSPAVDNLNARLRAWWVMIVIGALVLWMGRLAIVMLFGALAWWALSEFTPRGWFFVLVPCQFALVALEWFGLAAALIPAACLFLRNNEQRLGLLLCAYALSWIPALAGETWGLYFVLVVQASDVLQYLWGRAIGRHKVAPRLSPSKTVEGLIGGVLSATALGTFLHFLTPFSPARAAMVAFVITTAGFFSGLLFSKLKRERGIKDWGSAIAGHGGVLDRVDSLCLSAPLFYLATRLF